MLGFASSAPTYRARLKGQAASVQFLMIETIKQIDSGPFTAM
jgi:hypothetical protein